jgi:RNA polymerase sigma factor (sigma-70 family)
MAESRVGTLFREVGDSPAVAPPTFRSSAKDGDTTSPTLLEQVRDWQDHPAWTAFFARYNPLLRLWCRRSGLVGDIEDEVCHRIWIDLISRMRRFRYDPGGGFRHWLWRLFRSRAVDVLRKQRTARFVTVEQPRLEQIELIDWDERRSDFSSDDDRSVRSSILLKEAQEAQDAVRARVSPETWLAYWMIAIDDQPVAEVARSLGKKYAAVYNGYQRVDQMLRHEGRERLAAILRASRGNSGPDQLGSRA